MLQSVYVLQMVMGHYDYGVEKRVREKGDSRYSTLIILNYSDISGQNRPQAVLLLASYQANELVESSPCFRARQSPFTIQDYGWSRYKGTHGNSAGI